MSRINPFSPFAQFNIEFRGYEFYDRAKDRVISMYEFYHSSPRLCAEMVYKSKRKKEIILPNRYQMRDKDGWVNGKKKAMQ